jgi:hypothetical protein
MAILKILVLSCCLMAAEEMLISQVTSSSEACDTIFSVPWGLKSVQKWQFQREF